MHSTASLSEGAINLTVSYMDAHYFARPSIEDGSKVKIAAIHPDFERSVLLLSLMESAE